MVVIVQNENGGRGKNARGRRRGGAGFATGVFYIHIGTIHEAFASGEKN
jgi:hypothetical protein